ncbi:MAG: hypothetical protein ACXU9C_21010, partial [Xanthobacteraceae bacterium]
SVEQSDAPSTVAVRPELEPSSSPILGTGAPEGKTMAQTIREKAKIRQNREEDRPSEDDIAREHLGPRGQKGVPDTSKMTEDSKLQTPSPLDPGHTT